MLISGDPIQVWIDYDGFSKLISVTLAPINIPKPKQPLLSIAIDLSPDLLDSMYVGFSSATGAVASNHYVLRWSFNTSGEAQRLDLSKLPSLPRGKKSGKGLIPDAAIPILVVSVIMIIICELLTC